MFDIIAIGDPIIDTHVEIDDSSAECQLIPHDNMKLCFDYGSKIPILKSFQSLGGNAANVAIGTTKLGLKSTVLSTIGDDLNGEMVISELAKYGVDTFFLTSQQNVKTRYSIVLNYKEERTILSYSDKRTYFWPKRDPETAWIYYTGLSEGFEALHQSLIRYLQKHPTVKLAFNPGSFVLKYARNAVKEIIPRTDVLLVNLEEAEAIAGTTFEKEKSYTGIIHALLEMGAKEVVLTDAERGATAGNEDEIYHMKSLPVTVVNKTGAGDSFSAAYISARYLKHDIKNALVWGIINSSSVIGKVGSHAGLLDQKGIEKFTREHPSAQPFEV